MKKRFYGHFASAYGTLCLSTGILIVMTSPRVGGAELDLVVFPAIAILYAMIRCVHQRQAEDNFQSLKLEVAILQRERASLVAAVEEIRRSSH